MMNVDSTQRLRFHTANGIPGSHVTIRAKASEVTHADIMRAAAIAAWHSKAGKSSERR